jgi:L-ascorbate oxidase
MTKFRHVLAGITALFAIAGTGPAVAGVYDITVDKVSIDIAGGAKTGIGYNGASPGPTLRFKQGEDVTINVTNNLSTSTSIHWHGLILPFDMDGVPGISYDGIAPGETFTYKFPVVQSGTYWFHSHTGFQEPDGAYGSIIIEPEGREPFKFDREYVVQLTDKHRHSGARIMRNLKKMPDYYNRQQRTVMDFFKDVSEQGAGAAIQDRRDWGNMRMMRSDVEDLQGFTPLINGKTPDQNWTGLFEPGERIRLRFINSSAMTYFDIRIPGLELLVVQADGNNVRPVKVDEFRIAVAETYDVIVRPKEDKAFTIVAETMGRSAMARGTLAPREGMVAEVPALRDPPLLTMADMSLDPAMAGMDHGAMAMDEGMKMEGDEELPPGAHRMADGTIMGGPSEDPFYAAGSGLKPVAYTGKDGKFLSYKDLKAQKPLYEDRKPTREIELRLTGNMERYSWSINNIRFEDAEPIRLKYGERVRFKFINETMMTHPMHLHGMWSILDTGNGKFNPIKHTVSVSPGTEVTMETEVDAPGQWAFHCHLSYHAATGMFRKVIVEGGPVTAALTTDTAVALKTTE